jgi:hypothetical protein
MPQVEFEALLDDRWSFEFTVVCIKHTAVCPFAKYGE